MNTAFPRIITLLRKERGLSQKQAAADLEISQALLSHYEKGIRECGLDFVVRAADYYGVSCDYLLGRAADKSGAMIAVEEIPDIDPAAKDNQLRGSLLPVLNKKLIVNSVNVIFDLLQRASNKGLTTEVSAYLSMAVYNVFRQLYSANPKNPAAMFSVPSYMFQAALIGEMSKTSARIGELACGRAVDGEEGLSPEAAPQILPDTLAEQYPLFASSLFNLLRNAEGRLQ
ncbi:MAG: helix-turn-helix transcriptional regulator [Ruminococcaceae bacterium]|nr:helix-turn-helix transcriptional regulator [Oscillospiraceae bacterium]